MYGFKTGAAPKDKPKGGKIKGPGTSTSDSIKTEVPKGSYIMPADSTAKIGEKALGEMGKSVPVNLSNGEYQMPPEQVHAVGAQVLDQMKAATHTPVAAQGFKPQEGELYFADGGLVDEERRRLPASPLAVSYGDMTGRPGARPAPQPQQGAAAMPSVSYGDMQRAPSIPQPSTPAPARRIDSAPAPQPSAQGTPRAEQAPQQPAQQEAATTQEPQPSPTTFSSLQREPNIPRSGQPRQMPQGEPIRAGDIAQGFRSAGDAVADGLGSAARDFRAGGEAATGQIAGFAGRVANALSPDRNANYDPAALGQPEPNPNAGSAWGVVKDALLYSSDAEAIRQRNAASKAAPTAENAPGAVAPSGPAPGSASPKAEAPAASPRPQYGFTPDPMQGPALGMRVSPTSAPEIKRIDNAPGLNSPLFTNLPTGQAVSEMQGGTVNTMPAAAFQSAGPAASREVSAALQAAAARGDWDAVRGFYQRDGGTWQGRTAEQDAADNQGPRGAAIGSSRYGFKFARRSEDRAADRALADRRARREEELSRDRLDIDRQRAEGEAQARGFEVRGMERVERLYQQLEKAETPEERAAIAEQLRALSGKEAPNRFTVVPGGQEFDPAANMVLNRPAMVLNNQTGQPVNLGAAQASRAAMPPPNHIDALKKNPNQAAQFDAIYGEGAAARYLGAN